MKQINTENIRFNLRLKNDFDEISRYLVELCLSHIPCDGIVVNTWSAGDGFLKISALHLPESITNATDTYLEYRIDNNENHPDNENDPNIAALNNRETYIFDNMDQLPANTTTQSRYERWQMKGLAIFPICNLDKTVGTLMLFSQHEPIDINELSELPSLLSLFCPYLAEAPRLREIQQQGEYIYTLIDINDQFCEYLFSIPKTSDTANRCQSITHFLINYFDFDIGLFSLVEDGKLHPLPSIPKTEELSQKTALLNNSGLLEPYNLDINEGANPTCFLQKTPLHFPDIEKISGYPMAIRDRQIIETASGIKSVVYVPVLSGEKAIGTFFMMSFSKHIHLARHQIQTLESLCSTAADYLI